MSGCEVEYDEDLDIGELYCLYIFRYFRSLEIDYFDSQYEAASTDASNRKPAKKAKKEDPKGELPFRTRVQTAKTSRSAATPSNTFFHAPAGQNESLSGEETDIIDSPATSKRDDKTKRPARALRNTDESTFIGEEDGGLEVAGIDSRGINL